MCHNADTSSSIFNVTILRHRICTLIYMENNELIKLRRNIYTKLEQSRLSETFDDVEKLIDATQTAGMRDEVDQLKMSYRFMLQYLSQGVLDPQRDEVLSRIIQSLYLITDCCTINEQEKLSHEVFYMRRRELNGTPLSMLIEKWKTTLHKHELLSSVPAEQRNNEAITSTLRDCEHSETAIFNKLWCSFPVSIDDSQAVKDIIADDAIPSHAKCLFLSGWFLGLMKFYDETKLASLIEIYTTAQDEEVQIRALIYAILTLYIYKTRTEGSIAIEKRTAALIEHPNFASDFATLQFLLARSRNTDNISRRVREDLMPGLMNMSPDLIKKIKDKNAPLDIADLEANPEWQEFLDNSGITKKMEEFNEMQLDGNDVFISTFSHLKSFPFFQTMSNWFIPYHKNHTVIRNTFGDDENALRSIISNAPFLCNSDKYSFCLSMASVPQSQRQMMLNQVKEQNAGLKELTNAQLPDKKKMRESIANKHIQDLYRFFKLFSRRNEFVRVFDMNMDMMSLKYFSHFTDAPQTSTVIAEFYFKNKFYDDAIKYYNHVMANSETVNPHIFQKMGFAYQNLDNPRAALRAYNKHLLAHEDDVWTLKHMATCYRQLKRYDRSLDYYYKVEELQPQSVAAVLNIGSVLLESGDIEKALQYYMKADFMEGAKHKAWRPIAWCSFLAGNDERALNYYDKIINEDTPTGQDYLNRAHVMLCNKRIPKAIDNYKKSIEKEDSFESFTQNFYKDSEQLNKRGITTQDMALIVDALRLK